MTRDITTTDAAVILGVGERRVRALIKAGKLTARRLGRDHILDRRAVEQFAAKDRPPGRPTAGSVQTN